MGVGLVIGVYFLGYVAATTVAARNWFERFGLEFSGLVWAMMVGFAWPLAVVPYGVFLIVRGSGATRV